MRLVKRLLADSSGATAIEYGLICALIFLVIVGSLRAFASATTNKYNMISNAVSNATT